jgi:hypothetical protein
VLFPNVNAGPGNVLSRHNFPLYGV